MGLHHQGNHGRVFRGLEATQHLENRKRDSHGNNIKMNIPDSYKAKAAARPADPYQASVAVANKAASNDDSGVATIVSVVYQTVSADFTGPTAGYVTVTPTAATTDVAQSGATDSVASSSAQAAATSAQASDSAITSAASSIAIATSTATVSPSSASSETDDGSNNKSNFLNPPASATSSTSTASAAIAAVVGSGVATSGGATVAAGTPLSATRTAEAISNSSSGMTGGAKAGLAFGIIAALALCAGLLFFCYRRRKNQGDHQELGEKRASNSSSFFGGKPMSEKHGSVIAPSIRSTHTATTAPRLSLRPVTQFLPNISENRKSSGNNLDVAAAMSEKPKSMWERRSNNTENPFADAAALSEKQAHPETPSNPFDEPEGKPTEAEKSPSNRSAHSQKNSWEGSEPPTPKSTKFGTASAVAVAAAGTPNAVPPMPKGPNNVHRVQLDFKPSMDDELELISGQLVRVLHEYDDGWALCIRMDRTQQGVAPRTCLSKLPVKPRPQGPPQQGANGRPMTPTGPPGMMPRPLTPTSRERSGSNAGEQPASVPARKPVPGQAL